jgi:Cu+-exporting ATPase
VVGSSDVAALIDAVESVGKDATLLEPAGAASSGAKLSLVPASTASSADGAIRLKVEGMMCNICTTKVQRALEGVAGVTSVTVDLASGTAVVVGSSDVQATVDAVEAAGKEAFVVQLAEFERVREEAKVSAKERAAMSPSPRKFHTPTKSPRAAAASPGAAESSVTVLTIKGMTCSSCVGRVDEGLMALPGVDEVQVNLLVGKASVTHEPKVVTGLGRTVASYCRSSTSYQIHGQIRWPYL